MNRRTEDLLAAYAFGELSEAEAARVRAQIERDPEMLKTVRQFQEMRDGLRHLRAVPEDQLSKERLRDAILNQGLKPVPVRRSRPWAWMWMPVASAALAYVFAIQTQFRPADLVSGPPETKIAGLESAVPVFEVPEFDLSQPKPSVTSVAERPSTSNRVRRPRPDRPAPRTEPAPPIRESAPIANTMAAASVAGAMAARQFDTPPASDAPQGAEIVLIQNTMDASTGAQIATEVNDANDVAVGG